MSNKQNLIIQSANNESLAQAEALVLYLLKQNIGDQRDIVTYQRQYYRDNRDRPYLAKDLLLQAYRCLRHDMKIDANYQLEQWLVMKKTRSQSGIVVVSILTKPYNCPGNCLYCPTQADIPKSYLAKEPAVMRAMACKYDPFIQVVKRLDSLWMTGHPVNKINIRVIGGTFSYYPRRYQSWYMRRVYEACNVYSAFLDRSEEK